MDLRTQVAFPTWEFPRRIHSIPDFRHDVEHLSGDFAAALVVGGGFRGGVVAEPRVGVVNGVTRHGPLDDGARLVGLAARHEGDEALPGVSVGVVQLGVRADRGAVVGVSDEVEGIVAGGGVFNGKACPAHGGDGPAIAGGHLRAARVGVDPDEAVVARCGLSPDLRHVASPGVVGADKGHVRISPIPKPPRDRRGDLAQHELSLI